MSLRHKVGGKSYSSTLSLASVLEVGEWVVSALPRPLYIQETDLVPTVQETVWAMGASLDGTENLAPHWGLNTRLSSL